MSHEWGSQLVWEVRRNGQVMAQVPARANAAYQHPDSTPGQYEVVLQMFQYDGYAKDKDENFTQSKFVEVSNKSGYTV